VEGDQVVAIRVGLGCTLLERAMNGGHLDGIGVYTQNLHRELSQSADVTILPVSFPAKPWAAPIARTFPGRAAFGTAYGISAAVSVLTSLPFSGASELTQRVDVYHAPDHLIPKLKGVPVVATICDALAVKRPDWINAGPGAFRSALFKASAAWAQRVIAISAAMVPDLVKHFGVPEKSISVVHMGIGREWFQHVPEGEKRAVLEKYGLVPGYFLFVGTLQPRKNVENIVAAYEALPQELRSMRRLVIAGQAGWGSEQLVVRLRALEREGKCSWLQYVPERDLRAIYQGASVFVFPSLWEGFGIPVLEAFASRVPVITSNISSLPEVAGCAAIMVDPKSVIDLRDAMAQLADDHELAASLVEKGLSRASQMSWEACAAKTLEVYRTAI